jgi:hypothetical protein
LLFTQPPPPPPPPRSEKRSSAQPCDAYCALPAASAQGRVNGVSTGGQTAASEAEGDALRVGARALPVPEGLSD